MIGLMISGDRFFERARRRPIDNPEPLSWSITAHPRDRGAAGSQSRRGISSRETDARLVRLIRVRSMQHEWMMQTHLAGLHHHVLRRVDLNLGCRALGR